MNIYDNTVNRTLFDELMVPNYNPQDIIPVKGKGVRIWDQNGTEYLDFTGGIAVNVLGHCHPALMKVLNTQSHQLWHLSNIFTNEPALLLAKTMIARTFAEKVFFCNSGTEANEAAFKLARKYAHDHFGPHKHELIAFDHAFHGRSLFTVSVGGNSNYSTGFEPLPSGITHLPFNDITTLKNTISEKTCAVVLEPIQGEGGVIPATPQFLTAIRELCDQHKALMILDEVQTGVGRTGKLYAYMHHNIIPDILTTAKALGNGIPIGAMLTSTHIAKSFSFGTHGSTYGGNPLVCSVAKAVLDHIDDALLTQVNTHHHYFMRALNTINQKYDVFSTLRGQGLLIGCQLHPRWHGHAKKFLTHALKKQLMILVAGANVLRFAPALIISKQDIDDAAERLEDAISACIH